MNLARLNSATAAILCVAIVSLSGCGDNRGGLYGLSGQVTYDGKPAPFGEIFITPDSAKGGKGPGAMGKIEGGKYSLPNDQGHAGGPHKVQITITDGIRPEGTDGAFFPRGKPLISNYETNIDLKPSQTTADFVVPAK